MEGTATNSPSMEVASHKQLLLPTTGPIFDVAM